MAALDCWSWGRLRLDGGPPGAGDIVILPLLLLELLLLLLPHMLFFWLSCLPFASSFSSASLYDRARMLGSDCLFWAPFFASMLPAGTLWLFTSPVSPWFFVVTQVLALARSSSATARWG